MEDMQQKEKKIKVTQIASPIGRDPSQRDTLKGLGLNKISRYRILSSNPSIMGMVNKVRHLVKIDEIFE